MIQINSIGLEYMLRDIQFRNIYQDDKRVDFEDSSQTVEVKDAKSSYIFQSYEVLEEPLTVDTSLYGDVFQERVEKVKSLGFESIYSDSGHTILFHREKGGLCSVDKNSCKIDSVFLDKNVGVVAKVNGVAAICKVLNHNFTNFTSVSGFSYRDLPLLSSKDQESLPSEMTVEVLLGLTERNQVKQFEETGYVGDVDCRWAIPVLLQSRERRKEAEEQLFHTKMQFLPQEVQDFFQYENVTLEEPIVKTKSIYSKNN